MSASAGHCPGRVSDGSCLQPHHAQHSVASCDPITFSTPTRSASTTGGDQILVCHSPQDLQDPSGAGLSHTTTSRADPSPAEAFPSATSSGSSNSRAPAISTTGGDQHDHEALIRTENAKEFERLVRRSSTSVNSKTGALHSEAEALKHKAAA